MAGKKTQKVTPAIGAGAPVKASERALAAFMEQQTKTYGDGKFALGKEPEPYEVISTGSITLDRLVRIAFKLGQRFEMHAVCATAA